MGYSELTHLAHTWHARYSMHVQACHCRGRTAPQFLKGGIFPAGACAWPGPEDHDAELFDGLCTLDATQIRMAMRTAPWFLQLIEILHHSVVQPPGFLPFPLLGDSCLSTTN